MGATERRRRRISYTYSIKFVFYSDSYSLLSTGAVSRQSRQQDLSPGSGRAAGVWLDSRCSGPSVTLTQPSASPESVRSRHTSPSDRNPQTTPVPSGQDSVKTLV